ncbi:MAG: hypothetical protein LV479_10080 [Methylacidiphilales bacterium]|nr:hypothetical protein [Candidatus Methylacidiphilales bacterium]
MIKLTHYHRTGKIAFRAGRAYIRKVIDGYPFNLVLAVAAASITLFLGYLPIKTVSPSFFSRQMAIATGGWGVVALLSPAEIVHYPILLAVLCLVGWRQFAQDEAFWGKMWLMLAAGLGISIGVLLILAVTPRAWPEGIPAAGQAMLLGSIYVGGGIIGLGYMGVALSRGVSANQGVTPGQLRQYVGLLVGLCFIRAALAWGTLFLVPGHIENSTYTPGHFTAVGSNEGIMIGETEIRISWWQLAVPGVTLFVLPGLALWARGKAEFSSRALPTRVLGVFCVAAGGTEIAARFWRF